MNDFELRRQLATLRQHREPPHDLWPAIDHALATRPRHRADAGSAHWRRWALAASLLLASLLLWPQTRDAVDPAEVALAHRATAHAAVTRQADALRVEYAAALAQLAATPLPDDLRDTSRALRHDEQAIREALRQHPQSTFLLGQLRRTYEHQLRISQLAAFG